MKLYELALKCAPFYFWRKVRDLLADRILSAEGGMRYRPEPVQSELRALLARRKLTAAQAGGESQAGL